MPHSNISSKTRDRARKLRRQMTRAEIAMWSMLRDLRPFGARFSRETPIGPYIADFAWLSAGIVVEVDGDSHERMRADAMTSVAINICKTRASRSCVSTMIRCWMGPTLFFSK